MTESTLTQAQVHKRTVSFLNQAHVVLPAQVLREISTQLYQKTEGDAEQLEAALKSLTAQDFAQAAEAVAESQAEQVAEMAARPFAQKHRVRVVAIIALICAVIGMWWYGKHPPSHSPPPPQAPYHYPMVQRKPLSQPVMPSTPAETFYTIQVMGSHERQEADQFIQKHHLGNAVKVYQEQYQDKPWYIVGVGRYTTRQDASAELGSLKGKGVSGWVRPMHEKAIYVPLMNVNPAP